MDTPKKKIIIAGALIVAFLIRIIERRYNTGFLLVTFATAVVMLVGLICSRYKISAVGAAVYSFFLIILEIVYFFEGIIYVREDIFAIIDIMLFLSFSLLFMVLSGAISFDKINCIIIVVGAAVIKMSAYIVFSINDWGRIDVYYLPQIFSCLFFGLAALVCGFIKGNDKKREVVVKDVNIINEIDRLSDLNSLYQSGLITKEEFDIKKKQILRIKSDEEKIEEYVEKMEAALTVEEVKNCFEQIEELSYGDSFESLYEKRLTELKEKEVRHQKYVRRLKVIVPCLIGALLVSIFIVSRCYIYGEIIKDAYTRSDFENAEWELDKYEGKIGYKIACKILADRAMSQAFENDEDLFVYVDIAEELYKKAESKNNVEMCDDIEEVKVGFSPIVLKKRLQNYKKASRLVDMIDDKMQRLAGKTYTSNEGMIVIKADGTVEINGEEGVSNGVCVYKYYNKEIQLSGISTSWNQGEEHYSYGDVQRRIDYRCYSNYVVNKNTRIEYYESN